MRTAILVCLLGCGLGFNFLSIGDWGDVGAKEVAPTMAKYEVRRRQPRNRRRSAF